MPTGLLVQMEQETEDTTARPVVSAFLALELGNLKTATEMHQADLCTADTSVQKVQCSAGEIASGIRRLSHDAGAQQPWQGHDGDLACKTRVHPSLHRGQQLQLLLEQRGEVNREQYCEQVSDVGKRLWPI